MNLLALATGGRLAAAGSGGQTIVGGFIEARIPTTGLKATLSDDSIRAQVSPGISATILSAPIVATLAKDLKVEIE